MAKALPEESALLSAGSAHLGGARHALRGKEGGIGAAAEEAAALAGPIKGKLPVGAGADAGALLLHLHAGEWLGQHFNTDAGESDETENQVPVLMAAETSQKRAGQHQRAGEQKRGSVEKTVAIAKGSAQEEVARRIAATIKAARQDLLSAIQNRDESRADHWKRIAGGVCAAQLLLNAIGHGLIVVVEQSDPLTGGVPNADVAGLCPADRLGHGDDVKCGRGNIVEQGEHKIVRAIHNDNDLNLRVCLRESTLNGADQLDWTITCWDDKTHQRVRHVSEQHTLASSHIPVNL